MKPSHILRIALEGDENLYSEEQKTETTTTTEKKKEKTTQKLRTNFRVVDRTVLITYRKDVNLQNNH